jgi:hypothetical protein
MPNYNSTLQTNNSSLEEIITQLNNMPDAGGTDTSDATATAGDILNGKTAYVKGEKITGNIAFQAAQTITPGTVDKTIAAGKYLAGAQTIKGDANLVASNIVSGKSIFGVVGTATAGGGGDTSQEDGLVERNLTTYTNDRVTSIGIYTFHSYPSLTSVSFPKVTSIGDYAFWYCTSLTRVSFPVATSIGIYAFNRCSSLTSVSFPVATSIGVYTFSGCTSLTSVSFPKVTRIDNYAFYGCSSLTRVSFPVATSIGKYAFSGCTSLTSVSFPKVTRIDSGAFSGCTSLTSVSFPKVTSIGSSAFNRCSSLASIYLGASTVCTLGHSNVFSSTAIWSNKGSIFVPASLLASYKAATNWAFFSARIFSMSSSGGPETGIVGGGGN